MEKGMKQGLAQGIQQGVKESRISIAKKMIDIGIEIKDIIKATELSYEEVKALK